MTPLEHKREILRRAVLVDGELDVDGGLRLELHRGGQRGRPAFAQLGRPEGGLGARRTHVEQYERSAAEDANG